MDLAAPKPVPAPATDTDAETNCYEDASEFEDAEAGGEGAGAGTKTGSGSGTMPAGSVAEMKELPEELAKGVVCLKCETSAEAAAAGVGRTCRVYVVVTAHVLQGELLFRLSIDAGMFYKQLMISWTNCRRSDWILCVGIACFMQRTLPVLIASHAAVLLLLWSRETKWLCIIRRGTQGSLYRSYPPFLHGFRMY
jgi:hypothetical protein